jgi:Ni,Fe-hydrogenase I large subunit
MFQKETQMTADPQTYTVVDPRTFDGNPYEVAGRAMRQLASLVEQMQALAPATSLMVRNAYMERNLAEGKDAGAKEWPESAQGRMISTVTEELSILQRQLNALAKAGEFDPKHPPRA